MYGIAIAIFVAAPFLPWTRGQILLLIFLLICFAVMMVFLYFINRYVNKLKKEETQNKEYADVDFSHLMNLDINPNEKITKEMRKMAKKVFSR